MMSPSTLFSDMKSQLTANLEDTVSYFSEMQEKKGIVLLMIALSSFVVCVGLNFQQSAIIYSGLFISPFIYMVIQFTLGVYRRDSAMMATSGVKIVLGTILSLVIGFLYFQLTPFAYSLDFMQKWSEVPLSTYIVLFMLGVSIDIFNRHKIPMIIWVLKWIFPWPVLLILASFFGLKSSWDIFLKIWMAYFLVFFFFFTGWIALLASLKIARKQNEHKSKNIIYSIIIVLLMLFGIYFGFNEILRLTTSYNVEQYLHNEMISKSFAVNNFLIEKKSKTITVYFTGIKPVNSQDETLKNRYHLSNYHIEYVEFK